MTTAKSSSDEITWEPPGPGTWERDVSHAPPAGTPLFRRIMSDAPTEAYRGVFERFGGPIDTIQMTMVRGGLYRRVVPLVGASRGGPPPPKPILWLASRLHPKFRQRNKRALETFNTMSYLDTLTGWEEHERNEWIAANQAFQNEDIASYDDEDLAAHLDRVAAHLLSGHIRHHVLHGTDMGPIGDLLVHCMRWGLDPLEVMPLLQGASPATREAAEFGAAIADALRSEGVDPATVSSIGEIRTAGPESEAALDAYLDLYGWRLVTSYDIEGLTVGEIPASVVSLVRSGAAGVGHDDSEVEASATRLRQQVAAEHLPLYDKLMSGARRAYGLRDDNGPLTAEWTLGLTRRAYLEAGPRLASAGLVSTPQRVFELDSDEVAAALRGSTELTSADIDERATHREWEATLEPPLLLGDPLALLDSSALPEGLRRVTDAVIACVAMLEKEPGGRPLEGMGIGTESYTGRARLASRPEDVLATFELGDVLVAAWTAPTFNSVIASAGAMVVEEGGLLCHAAVIARELGVPAVIGATGALSLIEEGATVTVDPVAGRVTVEPVG